MHPRFAHVNYVLDLLKSKEISINFFTKIKKVGVAVKSAQMTFDPTVMPYQCQPLMDPDGPASPLTVLGSRAPPGWAEPNQATRGNVAWDASGAASPLGSNKPGNWC